MTVLTASEVVETVCDELSLTQPSDLVGATDKGTRQLLALLNKTCRRLSARWAWQVMTWECTFLTNGVEDQGSILTMVDAIDQTWRYVLNDTMFDRTRRMPIGGPLSPLDYQMMKCFNITQPLPQYRIDKNRILLLPIAPEGHTVAFEFVSRSWATAQNGAYKEFVDQNDDLIVLDTDLVVSDMVWRWRKAKELDYAEDFAEHERNVEDAITRDKTARKLTLASPGRQGFFPGIFVQAGDYPVTLG